MERARAQRTSPETAGSVQAYRADAEGHVYFYLDREDGGDPIPMRVDQVAVDLYWKAPDSTHQEIRALRKRELLPVKDFQYYIDRLTVVQNGFGDVITIGQGRDVRGVPHPLSPAGRALYHFRIVERVTVSIPSLPEPVRVFEVQVRPRSDTAPGFVGSLFLEASTGALTRARFTFTPASYVDPRVDNITVALDHALWEDRYWLPYKQVLEVRREIPELDLPVGSMIRATLEVDAYEFNPVLPPGTFAGPRIRTAGYETPDSSEFRTGLMDNMEAEGLSPITMADLESEARRTVRSQMVSGLPRVRFYTDRFSSVLRANRAEGIHVGAGASFSPHPAVRVEALAGYGLGSEKPTATAEVRWQPPNHPETRLELSVEARSLRDLGPLPGASGAVSSVSALAWNEDLIDPYFATGAAVGVARELPGGGTLGLTAGFERHRAARQVWLDTPLRGLDLRPVWPARDGDLLTLETRLDQRWGGEERWGAALSLAAGGGRWEERPVGSLKATLGARLSARDLTRRLSLSLVGASVLGDVPGQLLHFIGGRGTLPGHGYRDYAGKDFGLVTAEASLQLVPGWLTGRLIGGAGAVGRTPAAVETAWRVGPTGGLLGYVGLGAATLHELLRIDGAWGLGPGGRFEVVISVDPRLGPYL